MFVQSFSINLMNNLIFSICAMYKKFNTMTQEHDNTFEPSDSKSIWMQHLQRQFEGLNFPGLSGEA